MRGGERFYSQGRCPGQVLPYKGKSAGYSSGWCPRAPCRFMPDLSLLACFDDVLNIPEFLSVSIQEMTKHLDFFMWALRSGDPREFALLVVYLQG